MMREASLIRGNMIPLLLPDEALQAREGPPEEGEAFSLGDHTPYHSPITPLPKLLPTMYMVDTMAWSDSPLSQTLGCKFLQ